MIPAALVIASLAVQSTPGKPETFVEKIPGTLGTFKMVRIPDGKITVAGKTFAVKNLWAAETEVTWDVYDIYFQGKDLTEEQVAAGFDAKSRPSRPYGAYDRGFGHNGYPAIGVAFNGAEMFCVWLSKKTGKKYRLPTEAEWEYMGRANASEPTDLEKVAWFWDNAGDGTRPVAKLQPNAFGLFDTLGNASEWCIGLDEKPVTRGGSWKDKRDVVNYGTRVPYSPKWQERDAQLPKSKWWLSDGPFVGFRVVLVQG